MLPPKISLRVVNALGYTSLNVVLDFSSGGSSCIVRARGIPPRGRDLPSTCARLDGFSERTVRHARMKIQ